MKPILLSLVSIALCSNLLVSQVAAQPKPFAVLPGGGMAYKEVTSVRERRFINLVEQVLNEAYGWDLSEADVIHGMLAEADLEQVRVQGFSMLDMKRYAQTIGLRARGYRIPVEQLEQVKVPAIVLVDIRGYKHFVVIQRSADGWVYIGDPVLGHKRVSMDEFATGWNGIVFAVIGPGYDRNNALLTPPEPLTAKHRLDRFQLVQDAELMEFGFIQSDFF